MARSRHIISAPRQTESGVRDRDIDPVTTALRPAAVEFLPPERYQRLVANPFLFATVMVAWVAYIRVAIESVSVVAFGIGVLLLPVMPLFLQFHCLDCGRTDWLRRRGRHVCEGVVLRSQVGTRGWLRAPSASTQTKLWILALFIMLIGWILSLV